MTPELKQQIIDLIKHHELFYVDYNDNLDEHPEIIESIINTGYESDDIDIREWWDYGSESLHHIMNEVKESLFSHGEDDSTEDGITFESLEDEIRDIIQETCENDPMKQIVKNTSDIPARAILYSNYDCMNSDWYISQGGYEYIDSYFGHLVDTLNLNPALVKKALIEHGRKTFGRFPDKPTRNGKEYVSYKDLITELENSCGSCNNLAFVGLIDLSDCYGHAPEEGKPRTITIPKGNNCGLFDQSTGSGSVIEMKLLRDFTFQNDTPIKGRGKWDTIQLHPDIKSKNGHGYTMDEVYGPTKQFYGDTISFS